MLLLRLLKLVFATLWRASERWRRVRFSEYERKALDRYRENRQAARSPTTSSTKVA